MFTKRLSKLTCSCFERDQENFRKVVSAALNIQSWRVADVKYEQMKTDKDCMTYKFLLIGESLYTLLLLWKSFLQKKGDKFLGTKIALF